MTLDEAIAFLEKMVEENEEKASLLVESENVSRTYWEYAARFRVVACWLIELKIYRGMIPTDGVDGALDIIDKYRKIERILDDCDLEAWEVLEKIKEVVKA